MPSGPKIDGADLSFKRLSAECGRGAFSCGYDVIDKWFQNRSLPAHLDLYSRVTTAHYQGNLDPIGFYSLKVIAEPESDFGETLSLLRFINQKRILTLHLEWLGVSTGMQRRGIGTIMMGRILEDLYQVADRSGICALTLTSIDPNSTGFYNSLGFAPYGSGNSPQKLYLAAQSVIDARESELGNGSAIETEA